MSPKKKDDDGSDEAVVREAEAYLRSFTNMELIYGDAATIIDAGLDFGEWVG